MTASTKDPFWSAYFRRFTVPPPDRECSWQITDEVVRFVGPQETHHGYSVVMNCDVIDEALQLSIVKKEKLLGLSQKKTMEWKVFETPHTPHLSKALEQDGFSCVERSTLLYLSATSALPVVASQGLRIHQASTQEDFDQIKAILFDVWGKAEQAFIDALRFDAQSLRSKTEVFLAYLDDVPVSCGWMKYYGDIAHFFGGSTLAVARGKGAYKALASMRFAVAKKAGMKYVVSECSPHSERVLRKLGFHDAGQVFRYVHP